MWLLDYITKKNNNIDYAEKGKVSSSVSSELGVVSSNSFQALKQAAPYGIISIPPNGENAVVIPLKDTHLCLGTVCENTEIEPGELLLFSKGGAEILLSNDGKVYINGKEF
ncbi:MAG: hypothetical protein ACI4W1_08265 [Ruminococcus sp.]